jgi:hypothetical protein
MQYTWFTLSASAMSAIFVPLVGFRVGNVLPEMESTNSLLMNNCNRGKKKIMNGLNVINLNNSGVHQCITCSKIKLQGMYKGRRHNHVFTKYAINIYSKTLQYMMSHVLESSDWHIYMGRL